MTAASYFQGRLDASILLMEAATDPCVRKAHEGFVTGYRARLAESRLAAATPYKPIGQSRITLASGMRRHDRQSLVKPR